MSVTRQESIEVLAKEEELTGESKEKRNELSRVSSKSNIYKKAATIVTMKTEVGEVNSHGSEIFDAHVEALEGEEPSSEESDDNSSLRQKMDI